MNRTTLETPLGPVQCRSFGDGPTLLVVLHASATGPSAYGPLVAALDRPGRSIVVPALQGYDGTALTLDSPLDANVAVTRAVLEHHDHERAFLFGHSMGGLVAVNALAGGLPVSGLALYEPILMAALDSADEDDMALLAWDQGVVATLRAAVADGRPDDGVAAFVAAWNELDWGALPERVRERLAASARALVEETTATNAAPAPAGPVQALGRDVLMMRGTRSPPLAHRIVERFAAAAGAHPVTVLEGSGHMAPLMNADALIPALDGWLSRAG